MKLSIVIPCYNERHTIQDIVTAVKNSPIPNKEIVIVDDCSTDGTRRSRSLLRSTRSSTTKSTRERAQHSEPGLST
jgi:cellulose synthase/poly-beta-1,6-N-acetylglucosamine synthase-like glycosyltransferase